MAWYDGAIFYHILPGGMFGEEGDGEKSPLSRLEGYLSYLKVLGVDAVILGPLFSGDPLHYGMKSFSEMNPKLGTEEELCRYINRAHSMGIRVLFDEAVVFSCREFFIFRDILEKGDKSPYKTWYKNVDFQGDSSFHDGFSYASWKRKEQYPLFNFDDEDLRIYIIDQIKAWIQRFDIDGIRIANCTSLDIHFQKSLRYFTGQMKPEFFLLGDLRKGEPLRYVNSETLQSLCHYDFYQALVKAFNEKNFYDLAYTMGKNHEVLLQMNSFLESPRTDRISSVLTDRANLYGIYMALFTLPGRPSLYYGAEYALEGKRERREEALLSNPFIPEDYKPDAFTNYLAKLSEIHGKNSELQIGAYKELYLDHRLYAFIRTDGNSGVLVLLNNDSMDQYIRLKLPIPVTLAFDLIKQEEVEMDEYGQIKVFCAAHSGRMIKVK